MLALAATVLLAACDTQKRPDFGQIGAVPGFIGGAVVEEPHAALAARDALSAGGTAADAVVSAYFTMAATYPVAVGLGGGGVCVYYDAVTNKAETLDFLAVAPQAGGRVAIPGAIRGMALMHSRYGRLRFGQLLRTGETLARFGHPVSRAFARRAEPHGARLAEDPFLQKTYLNPDGSSLEEGDQMIQVELAATLSRLRTKGIADFYGGELGRRFVEAAEAAGGKITLTDLRQYRAVWRDVQVTQSGNLNIYHPVPPPITADALRDLTRAAIGSAATGSGAEALTDVASGDAGSASVVVADRRGSAAACSFSMHQAFGLGRVAPTLGVPLAPVVDGSRMSAAVAVAANVNLQQAFFAAGGSGGRAAFAAVAQVTADVVDRGEGLEDAMMRPRALPAMPGSEATNETGGPDAAFGRVQALWCGLGIRRAPKTCRFVTDPRGFGLAASQLF